MAYKTVAGLLPDAWKGALIKNVCNVVRGSSPRPAGSPIYFYGDYLPWVTVADITKDEKIYLESTKSKLTEEGAKCTRITEPGTLFLSNSGATLGVPKISKIKSGANDGVAMLLNLKGVTTEFAYYYLSSKTVYFREVIAPGIGQPNLNTDLIGDFPIPIPPLSEQKKIAKILTTWDKSIGATEQLLANSQQKKKGLMQQLLTGKKRFPEFSGVAKQQSTRYGPLPGDWGFIHIEDIARQVTQKNSAKLELPVLSCSKHVGFVDSLKYFNKKVYSDDTSGYKVIERGCFGFPSNHIEEGSIGYQNLYDAGIVSPIYTIFRPNPKKINSDYLYKLLKTDHYRQIFCAATNASVDRRGSLRWKEFSKIRIPLPSLEEQQKIASVLTTTDREIGIILQKLDFLKKEKKALMQQLLTGKRRVNISYDKES